MTIPDTTNGWPVTSIGNYPFIDCSSLTTITVATGNSVYSSLAGVLFNSTQTTLIQYPEGEAGSYTIPTSVTSIGDGAFAACSSLTSVVIPSRVTSIGDEAFSYCTGLMGIYFQGNPPKPWLLCVLPR